MLFLTVPTRGDHQELLAQLIADSGLPRDRVIVVRTYPGAPALDSAQYLDDFGPINIQRWWNAGIAWAEARGATMVAVANDDIAIDPDTLDVLAGALARHQAAIASPGRRVRLYRHWFPVERRLDGALWLLDLSAPVRPNEAFRWAWGDDDLDLRARRAAGGVVTVPVEFANVHHNTATSTSPYLTQLSDADMRTFARMHSLIWALRFPRRVFRAIRARISDARVASGTIPLPPHRDLDRSRGDS